MMRCCLTTGFVLAALALAPATYAAGQTCNDLFTGEVSARQGDAPTSSGAAGGTATQYGAMRVYFDGKAELAPNRRIRKSWVITQGERLLGRPKGDTTDRAFFQELFDRFVSGEPIPGFQGSAGLVNLVLLFAVKDVMFDQPPVDVNNPLSLPPAGAKLRDEMWINPEGRIDEYEVVDGPNGGRTALGFHVNFNDMSGSISVTMCFEAYNQDPRLGGPPARTYRYRLLTTVNKCGWRIMPRIHVPTVAGRPLYPNLQAFDNKAVRITQAMARDAQWAIQAQGTVRGTPVASVLADEPSACEPTGEYMHVTQAWGDPGTGTMRALSPNQPQWANIFGYNDGSCIDMILNNHPIEGITPDAERPRYCLGRCSEPAVINSGL